MQNHLIITADDFGLREQVNQAVEDAARNGVLSAASLMVGAPAAADAVRRAAKLPKLRVGLHLVLADGYAVLPPHDIPALADFDGLMGDRMAYDGFRFFFLPRVRQQLEAEIRAQFAAFARTGMHLDHVNTHKHFHLHPTVLEILLRVGCDYGRPPVRATTEPLSFAFRNGPGAGAAATLLRPWAGLLRRKLRSAAVAHNDHLFGISASGAMDEDVLLHILKKLPSGVTEIYLHPANTAPARPIAPAMRGYRHYAEYAAITSGKVRDAILATGATQGGFLDMPVSRR